MLILGSNSFAGASFVNHSLDLNLDIVGVSRSEEKHNIFLPYAKNPHRSNFKFYQLDINKHFPELIDLINTFRPDVIVDFAGQGMVAQSWDAPLQWFQTNLMSKIKLHELLRKLSFLKAYMRVSTPEVYGSTEGSVNESAKLNPSTPYAVSHAAIDMSLMSYYKNYNFPVYLTRSTNFYGPGQQLYRIIPRTIIYARLGKKLSLHGGGTSVRNFVHSRDFGAASWAVLNQGKPGEIYHIASDEYLSIKSLVEMICDKLGNNFNDFVQISKDRPGKDKAYYLDTQKTQSLLCRKNKISLEAGISETIHWVKDSWETIKDFPMDYIHME
ncbi:MAG: GDP-mannose 4,6-dehydratase [Bacteriovoracaceae bacterium]|nr:GDP-mannose 4,6-dehydratase [Bacteriovoracaceae bacterium]